MWSTSSAPCLGIIVDESLSFKDYIVKVSNILAKNFGMIRKLKHCFLKEKIRMLYFNLIPPYFVF